MRPRTHRLIPPATLAVALLLGACGPGTTLGPDQTGAASVAPVSLRPATLGPPATLSPGSTPLVRIDPSLLSVLPPSIDGVSVLESSEGNGDAESNASLARIAEAAVGALAVDLPADFVYALVVRLEPGALDDAGFRNWRDAYDAGACLGQVAGRGETQIDGRTVFVGTCVSGIHTYHTWIAEHDLLVSASSGGARQLGQALFGDLRPD